LGWVLMLEKGEREQEAKLVVACRLVAIMVAPRYNVKGTVLCEE
jgi:hypothetical protein